MLRHIEASTHWGFDTLRLLLPVSQWKHSTFHKKQKLAGIGVHFNAWVAISFYQLTILLYSNQLIRCRFLKTLDYCTEVRFLNSEELSRIKSSPLHTSPAARAGEELIRLNSSAPGTVQKSHLCKVGRRESESDVFTYCILPVLAEPQINYITNKIATFEKICQSNV